MCRYITRKKYLNATKKNCPQSRVFVLPGPREKFSETEINYMKKYLESGGSIFVLLGEGGEKR